MSLLCSSLQWLKDNQQRLIDSKRAAALRSTSSTSKAEQDTLEDDDGELPGSSVPRPGASKANGIPAFFNPTEPDWVIEQTKTRVENQKLALIEEEVERQRRRKEYLRNLREQEKTRATNDRQNQKRQVGSSLFAEFDGTSGTKSGLQKMDSLQEDFAVDDYASDEDDTAAKVKKILARKEEDDIGERKDTEFEEGEELDEIKVGFERSPLKPLSNLTDAPPSPGLLLQSHTFSTGSSRQRNQKDVVWDRYPQCFSRLSEKHLHPPSHFSIQVCCENQ